VCDPINPVVNPKPVLYNRRTRDIIFIIITIIIIIIVIIFGLVAGFCEYGNKLSDSMNSGQCLDYLSKYYHLKWTM
jgi:hypothetical protein